MIVLRFSSPRTWDFDAKCARRCYRRAATNGDELNAEELLGLRRHAEGWISDTTGTSLHGLPPQGRNARPHATKSFLLAGR